MVEMRGKPPPWIKLQPEDPASSSGAAFSLDKAAYAARQEQGAKTWEKGRWGMKKERKEKRKRLNAAWQWGKDGHGENRVGRRVWG